MLFAQIVDNLFKIVLTVALFVFGIEQRDLLDFIFKRNQFRYTDDQCTDRLCGAASASRAVKTKAQ